MQGADPWDDHLSPDGSIRIEIEAREMRASAWVLSPRVIDTRTGEVLLDFWRTNWDAAVSWPKADTALLVLRQFNFPGAYTVLIDPKADTYTMVVAGMEGRMPPQPLAGLKQGIEAAFYQEHPQARQRCYSADSDSGSYSVSITDLIKSLMGGPALVVAGICIVAAGFVLDEPLLGVHPGRLGLLNRIELHFGAAGAIFTQILFGLCTTAAGLFITQHGIRQHRYFRFENRANGDRGNSDPQRREETGLML